MPQNADDAGAHVVKFCLDARSHGTGAPTWAMMGVHAGMHHATCSLLRSTCAHMVADTLAASGLAPFQGPALLAFNDAEFSEADFASISNIGNSVKRDQKGKTGRFGVGFNACYHLTDLPSFASGQCQHAGPSTPPWHDLCHPAQDSCDLSPAIIVQEH